MLLDVGPDGGKASRMKLFSGLAAAFSISLLIVLFLIIVQDSGWLSDGRIGVRCRRLHSSLKVKTLIFSTAVKNFGYGLMTKYMLPLQISGFLLLAAMVGVIVLSKKRRQGGWLKVESITPSHYLILSLILFAIGFLGVLLRRNLLLVLMSLELMLNGINLGLG